MELFILHACKILESDDELITRDRVAEYFESFDVNNCAIEKSMGDLMARGYLVESDNGIFSLTDAGREKAGIVSDTRRKEGYNRFMLQIWNSRAYLDFCEDLYGYRWCLLNSLYVEQYQYLFNELQISSNDVVLDIGCGSGAIINNVVSKYACRGIGIDYARNLIAILKIYYPGIGFYDMDIEGLPFAPFNVDIIISLDSLYTCRNLDIIFTGMKSRCRRYMYAYYTQSMDDANGDLNVLHKDNTDIARALQRSDLNYSVIDFSDDEWNLWKKEKAILNKHRLAFEKEGNLSIWDDRVADTENMLILFADQRAKRFLYKITMGDY